MTRMFNANAEARTFGSDTLARAVFDGPVFRNRKNTDANIRNQAAGNGVNSMATNNGNARAMPSPDTKKYDPGYFGRNLSPTQPPIKVEVSPATTIINPKYFVVDSGWPLNRKYAATQKPIPPTTNVIAVWAMQFITYERVRTSTRSED